jgi:hypothetical protein
MEEHLGWGGRSGRNAGLKQGRRETGAEGRRRGCAVVVEEKEEEGEGKV